MEKTLPVLVFATNNPHKLKEARQIAAGKFNILSLDDIGCRDEIPETGSTLEENAAIKARWVKEKYGYDCFSDDTGLMVDALGGAPGVYSARYAGPECDSRANMALLLRNMEGVSDRRARFVTAVHLIAGGIETTVTGRVEGRVAEAPQGANGFGYDPVFMPDEGNGFSFAQMDEASKNAISHRGRAMRALADTLNTITS